MLHNFNRQAVIRHGKVALASLQKVNRCHRGPRQSRTQAPQQSRTQAWDWCSSAKKPGGGRPWLTPSQTAQDTGEAEFGLESFTLSHGKKWHRQQERWQQRFTSRPPSVFGGSMPWAVVDGSGGDSPPTEGRAPLPTERGQSNTGSSFEVHCLISHAMPDSPQTGS